MCVGVTWKITGTILCNCSLSGMPYLDLILNDGQRAIEDIGLHPCVKKLRYKRDGILSFVPPDGSFKLAVYMVRKTVSGTSLFSCWHSVFLFFVGWAAKGKYGEALGLELIVFWWIHVFAGDSFLFL